MAPRRVLVIDDSTTQRGVVEAALRGTGCEVDLAANGLEGVALARKNRPDVILLDDLLPDLRSIEVCQRLGGDAATAAVPVVIMSAHQSGALDEFRELPSVVGFLGKPFTGPEVRARLEGALRRPASGSGNALRGAPTGDPGAELQLAGELASAPLVDVLRLLTQTRATGTLVIHQVAATSRISVRRGEIVLCATTATSSLLAALAPDLRDRVARNAAAGKPAQITLAEAGAMRTANLPFELRAASAGLVAELLDARAGAFVWEPAALPEFVETYGRPIPLAALALDHARRTGVTGTVELLDQAYERARRVTPRLAGLALDATEQRMLALVDGRTTTRDLAARAGLSPDRAAATVARLYTADLIAPSAGPQVAAARTLAVIDADREGVIAPLRARLRRWPQPVEVVELDPDRPLAAAALELHAEMVWIGVAALTRDVIDHELPVLAKAGAWVVCVLDAPNPALAHQMLQAGVFAVLTKPVHVHEIERLMARPRTQEPPCPPSSS